MARSLRQRVPVAAVVAVVLLACALPLSVAMAAPAAQDTAPATLVGTYVSAALPSDQSDGLTITLTLNQDGTGEATSAEANDIDPLVEVGTWADNGDGTFTLTLTGTAEADYVEPVPILFQVSGDTITAPGLTGFGANGLVLTRSGAPAPAEAAPPVEATEAVTETVTEPVTEPVTETVAVTATEAITAAAEITATAPVTASADVTGTVAVTEAVVLPGTWGATIDADGVPATVVIWLGEDGTAQGVAHMFDGLSAPLASTGEWTDNGDNTLTITMTASLVANEDGSADPVEIDRPEPQTFEITDDTLVGTLFTLFRMDEPKPDVDVVSYVSDVLPAASSVGRVIALSLGSDGSAAFATDFLNGEDVIVELGEWVENEDGTITVTLTGREDLTFDEPIVITFEEDADGTLVAVEYDETRFGSEGLTLFREQAPAPEPTEEAAGN